MLRLEHDLLDGLHPVIPRRLGISSKRIVSFRRPQLELCIVDRIARRSVLKRDAAVGKVRVGGRFVPAKNLVTKDDPELGIEFRARSLLLQSTSLDYQILRASVDHTRTHTSEGNSHRG